MPLCRHKQSFPVRKSYYPFDLEGMQAKIQKTERKIEDYQTGKKTPKKVSLEICLKGLNARLTKLKEKESILLKHQADRQYSYSYIWREETVL